MTDIVTARAATETDLAVTAALSTLAQDELRDERGGHWLLNHDLPRLDPLHKHREMLFGEASMLAVGEIDGVVVGYGLAYTSRAHDALLCMIEELAVHPDARAVGAGSAILAELETWARAAGCAAIESQVLPGNRAAKNFFERVGMKTRKMRVSADL